MALDIEGVMTSMKHKSVDARRHRRSRLKRAVKPIMERFGCNQMQVADHVAGVIFQNDALRQKVERLEEKLLHMDEQNENLKSLGRDLKKENDQLLLELKEAKEQANGSDNTMGT